MTRAHEEIGMGEGLTDEPVENGGGVGDHVDLDGEMGAEYAPEPVVRAEGMAWTLPASIALGTMLAGVFFPALLILSAVGVVWLIVVHRGAMGGIGAVESSAREHADELETVRAMVRLLGSVIDAADVPIISTDSEGTIVQANRAAEEILGSGRGLIGDYFDVVMTQKEIQELERHARRGERGHARLDLPVGGAIRVFDVAVDPIASTGGCVCTYTDITELMRSVELKADFASNASHELRTPIASIRGAVETLEHAAKEDPEMSARLIGIISNNAMRLDMMVKDLLDLSKLESGHAPTTITRVGLEDLIETVCIPFQSVCQRKDLEIRTRIEEGLTEIDTDQALLDLIVRNLIENATKFAREGTAITIRIERRKVTPDRDVTVPTGLRGGMGVQIRVRDRGLGIPLAQQPRIFERFYQVDDARSGSWAKRGTGLGLAIVKHAARTLGGRVSVDSVLDQGTTMIVDLPGCAGEDGAGLIGDPGRGEGSSGSGSGASIE